MSSAYRWNAVVLPHTQPRCVICPTNIVFTGSFFHSPANLTASHCSASIFARCGACDTMPECMATYVWGGACVGYVCEAVEHT